MGSNPIGDAIFFVFFPIIVSNPCRKQSSAENLFSGRGFFFLRLFFAAQKMGLLTFLWVAVAPLRLVGLRPPSNPKWRIKPFCKNRSSRANGAARHLEAARLLRAKNGIAHFPVGCRRFAPARRAAPSLSNPIGELIILYL